MWMFLFLRKLKNKYIYIYIYIIYRYIYIYIYCTVLRCLCYVTRCNLLRQGSRGDRGESGMKGDKVGKIYQRALVNQSAEVNIFRKLFTVLYLQGGMGFPGMLGQKVRNTTKQEGISEFSSAEFSKLDQIQC